ncbi:MAG: hypothetical protein SV375_19700, partial [Thermodesulfobacteriota bacterium]|nr:hypothetical protein [Thermodesulfobacteriota bacterium]
MFTPYRITLLLELFIPGIFLATESIKPLLFVTIKKKKYVNPAILLKKIFSYNQAIVSFCDSTQNSYFSDVACS